MSQEQKPRKLRRFFTRQTLQSIPHDLWLDAAETHHLRDSIRLKPGDVCLVTDGCGGEAEAIVGAFAADGRACLHLERILTPTGVSDDAIVLRVFPAMLRKGKTDLLIEKAQEIGVQEFCAITSERCEVKMAPEKTGKIIERWNRISREASKQSGNLKLLRIGTPKSFKNAIESLPAEDLVVIFHPCREAVPFPQWMKVLQDLKGKIRTLNLFVGPEGGFSEDEIRWAKWHRKEKNLQIVELGEIRLKADTAFIGIIASLKFSGILSVRS